MGLDNVTLRAATLDALDGIAAIYNQPWCNTLRNRGDVEAADFCARFNIAMQLQRSPIALVAEAEGRIIAACCIGIFEDGKPRKNRRRQARGFTLWRQPREGHSRPLCRHGQRVCPGPAQPDHHRARVAGQGPRPRAY